MTPLPQGFSQFDRPTLPVGELVERSPQRNEFLGFEGLGLIPGRDGQQTAGEGLAVASRTLPPGPCRVRSVRTLRACQTAKLASDPQPGC